MESRYFEPERYYPDLFIARKRGVLELKAIRKWLGSKKDQKILEIGCGCGSLLLALLDEGYTDCSGIDQDQILVAHGRNTLKAPVAVASWAPYLEDKVGTFDAIIAIDVLEHLPREELLNTLVITYKSLAPGGRLILRMPNALCPFALATLYGDLTHQFLFTPRTVKYLLHLGGFCGKVIIEETRPSNGIRRVLFTILHRLIVRPLCGLVYYHFHGEFPSHLTPNIICCAYKS